MLRSALGESGVIQTVLRACTKGPFLFGIYRHLENAVTEMERSEIEVRVAKVRIKLRLSEISREAFLMCKFGCKNEKCRQSVVTR